MSLAPLTLLTAGSAPTWKKEVASKRSLASSGSSSSPCSRIQAKMWTPLVLRSGDVWLALTSRVT